MSALHAVALVCMLALVACGRDPILDAADAMQAGPRPGGGAGGSAGGGAGGGTGGEPGQPVEPPPGQGVAPPPGRGADPPPGVPSDPAPSGPGATQGPKVVISGAISLADYDMGKVRIDVFDGDQKDLSGPRPSVVAVAELDRPGPFSIEVPADKPRVWLGAFIDEDMDGRPGPQDPAGWYAGNPVDTEGGAEGVVIELSRQPPPPQQGL